mmetsp:Transcript_1479/g.3351  ORF Transcript_1479/g.3351 Transcript_1479/m.3351 type:complete len:339 (-) Transcript_1479:869-1885(-)|eukprot:CAMPEP_0181372214 /NCGR_PEP_ID=MMETSP1106-20121128/14574_1 /TAXON_ID=81844 /ORGANISM="Mantoniella antarctica, Strain SL-175" /LENGTH=338 /DNA_ID=CAMNT_0023489527 /DNA_START=181 /DNA_END=1197 /DNA_ORIENTATION=+
MSAVAQTASSCQRAGIGGGGAAVRQQRDSASRASLRGRPQALARRRGVVGRGAGLVCDAKLGIVGGSNLNDSKLFEHLEKRLVETEYGDVIVYDSPPDAEKQICFVKRHYCGPDESYVPPHLVKAPAFLKAFKQIGVTEVLQVCSVGSLVKGHIPPHSIIFPDDYIALWNMATYATNDKSGELLPTLDMDSRAAALAAVHATDIPLRMKLVECGATYVQTRGPRFETKAEIRALGVMGGDVVGMTGVSEVVLCNELRMPVSMVCFCDNYANGINTEMDAYNEFYSNVKSNMETVEETVACVIDALLAKQKAAAATGAETVGAGVGAAEAAVEVEASAH